jgi:hypothetical protein
MRPLTSTLLAAQRSPVKQEVVACRIVDAPVEWPRWSWTQIYAAADPDGAHAVVQLRSGPLVRARLTGGGAVDVQKIADPTVATQWDTWVALKAAGSVRAASGIALASSDAEDRLRLFYVDFADGRTIRCAESTDGVAWAEALVITEPAPRVVTNLAADMTAADNHLIYLLDLGGATPREVLVAIEKVAGAWVNRVQHAELRYPTRGLCAARDPAAGFVYCGVADGDSTGARRISFQEYNTVANAWAGGTVLVAAPTGSGFDYAEPRLRLATGVFPRHTYTFVEQYGGAVPYNRPTLAVTPQRYVLTEWVPWDVESPYGFHLLRTAAAWYLVGANRAYTSPLESGQPGQRVDASTDLVAFESVEPAPGRAARLSILLDNAAGGYGAAGQPGAKLAVREGSQLALGLGYRTTAGDEFVWTVPWWIERLAFEDDRGAGCLRLDCVDAWSYLERLRAPRQLVFPAGSTVGSVLNRLLWRVTDASLAETGPLATAVPGFTVGPGESYAHAIRRLCHLAGVLVRFGTNQAAPDGCGLSSVVPAAPAYASGASTYAYASADVAGSAAHPIVRASHAAGGQPFSQVELFGAAGLVGEALDHAAIRRTWKNVSRKLIDRAADTQPKADAAATAALTAAKAEVVGGYLEASPNVVLEIGDVGDVTDPRAGLNGAKRTVVGIRTVYDRRQANRFTQRLTLAGAS